MTMEKGQTEKNLPRYWNWRWIAAAGIKRACPHIQSVQRQLAAHEIAAVKDGASLREQEEGGNGQRAIGEVRGEKCY